MVNLLYRTAYRCAYQLMRAYWLLFHPRTKGALVALWHEGRLLVVRNSYVSYYSLPGGYLKRGEAFRDAAVRELSEELALRIDPADLQLALEVEHDWEGKRDHVQLFELVLKRAPHFEVDAREVVAACQVTPEQALQLELFPPLRTHVEGRLSIARDAPSGGS